MIRQHRALILTRRSSDNGQALSLAAQEDDCRRAAEANGWYVGGVFTDDGISGSAPLEKREGLLSLLSELKRGDILVCRSSSRLARNMGVLMAVEDIVAKKKARIFCIDGGLQGDDPASVLMRQIKGAFHQYELAVAAYRTRSALARARRNHRALGNPNGKVRYGFKMNDEGNLEVHEPEFKVVRQVLGLVDQGVSMPNVKKVLDAEGTFNREGKPFGLTSLYNLKKAAKTFPELYQQHLNAKDD
jgi:DNA invertase Pin-like site-specific DNA recombinase